MTSVNLLRRIELLERAVAHESRPELVFCWTRSLAERISRALGPNYEPVCITFPDNDAEAAFEAMIRENPDEAARLDRMLAGIPPD